MNRKINFLRAISIVALFGAMSAILIVFVAKKHEIEMQRAVNSVLSQSYDALRLVPSSSGPGIEEAAKWKLISGDPEDICTIPVYEGKASIRGWYVYDTGYSKEKEWLLRVQDEDANKLPLLEENKGREDFHLKVKLENVSQELEEKLKEASAESPVEIRISRYLAYCEGIPLASIQQAENI